ncbi:MAG: DUF3347 domain-containing protein [Flavisolibacter sp.]|nr:DUF3347 domain-containing protein [Flavisolibacter sp.]
MKKSIHFHFVLFVLLSIYCLLIACTNTQTPATITERPNELSNTPVDQTLAAYYALSEAFVNWDTAAIHAHATLLQQRLQKIEGDTAMAAQKGTGEGPLAKQAAGIAQQKDITRQRRTFDSLSQKLYTWLNQNKYAASAVYLEECPMAFNDEEKGQWLSRTEAIRNPYLGLHHPKYKKGMVECGSIKDSIQKRQ